jgi:hypothetical protein
MAGGWFQTVFRDKLPSQWTGEHLLDQVILVARQLLDAFRQLTQQGDRAAASGETPFAKLV